MLNTTASNFSDPNVSSGTILDEYILSTRTGTLRCMSSCHWVQRGVWPAGRRLHMSDVEVHCYWSDCSWRCNRSWGGGGDDTRCWECYAPSPNVWRAGWSNVTGADLIFRLIDFEIPEQEVLQKLWTRQHSLCPGSV
jgi:hypothetical protein